MYSVFTVTYIDENRTRVSAETAYLTEDVLARPNLTVVINATVTKILFEKNDDNTKAIGVEFARSKKGHRYTVRAKNEVIVTCVSCLSSFHKIEPDSCSSAGAIHSPHVSSSVISLDN